VTLSHDLVPLRAVLFDLDGTLLDSGRVDLLVLSRLFHDDLRLEVDEREVSRYIGVSSREVLEQLAPDRVEELLEVWLGYHQQMLGRTHLFPGVMETVHILAEANLALGVVTGQNRRELEVSRQHIAMDGLIDVWISADDAPFSKPHPAPVRLALDSLGCPPDQAIMVGDTSFDMEAGHKAGTLLGAVLWGGRDPASLLDYQPDYVFQHPHQMKDLLRHKS
jgi:pyrophosphatase PpaX